VSLALKATNYALALENIWEIFTDKSSMHLAFRDDSGKRRHHIRRWQHEQRQDESK
jgi:hypothetical protein